MAITPTPIFQTTFDNTEPQQVYKPVYTARLESIVFYNYHASAVTVTVYHDIDGDIYDDDSTIIKDESIAAGARYVFTDRLLLDASGNLAIEVSVVDVLVATGYAWVDDGDG